ncbi:MAG: hypothetical protein GY761_02475, partial [Hyphomicrobiales bacterium]|nr:hypothetical protein [Hyphomicrobiales bacterium]
LDAIIHGDVELKVDVRTPHKNGGDPVPLFFLTVAPGATVTFFIAPTGRGMEQLLHELDEEIGDTVLSRFCELIGDDRPQDQIKLTSWFANALYFLGAGARTKGGRGRMKQTNPLHANGL